MYYIRHRISVWNLIRRNKCCISSFFLTKFQISLVILQVWLLWLFIKILDRASLLNSVIYSCCEYRVYSEYIPIWLRGRRNETRALVHLVRLPHVHYLMRALCWCIPSIADDVFVELPCDRMAFIRSWGIAMSSNNVKRQKL